MFVLSDHAVISHDAESLAGQVYEATAQALAYTFAQRDPHALEQAATAIDAARRVFCMGTGGSSANRGHTIRFVQNCTLTGQADCAVLRGSSGGAYPKA
jgi:DNA-binding MurR/RpiR family transcriptional regulator